jgi:hypothetical protein
MYKFLELGVHAEVLDFPGTIPAGDTLPAARRLLASALVDMGEVVPPMCFGSACKSEGPWSSPPLPQHVALCGDTRGSGVGVPVRDTAAPRHRL